jgi:MFS family permease
MLLTTLRQRNFVLLWLGGLISQTGSLAGALVDRWDRKWTLIISMPTKSAPPEEGAVPAVVTATGKQLMQEWLEGLQLISRERTLTILLIAFILTGFGEGIFSVLLVVFVKQVLRGGAAVYGSLLAVQAVGSLIGGLVISHIGNRIPPLRLIGVGLVTFGFIDLPLFVPGLLLVFVLFILVGLPSTGALVGFNASVQILVEDKLQGRIFGTLLALRSSLSLLGMVVAGTLGDRLGPVLLLNAQGGMYMCSGLLVLLTLWNRMAEKRTSQGTGLEVKE